MNNTKLEHSRLKTVNLVKESRNAQGISQATLANLTGIGIATIKRFESGRGWMNFKQITIICFHLNINSIKL